MPLFLLFLALVTCASAAANPAAAPAAQGAAQLAKGDAQAAVTAFEKAVELDPANSDLHRQLGDAYGLAAQQGGMLSMMGRAKKSRLAYEKAVELDPQNLEARSSLMSFYQMAPSLMGGGPDKARAQAAAIKKLDDTRGRVAYATLYAGDKKYAEAFAEIEAALQSAPADYAALYQFGRIAALAGERTDRGIAALQKCLALPPAPGAPGHDAAHWRLGNLWEKKGDPAAARAAYQASLKINPQFQQAADALKKLGPS
ncbi:MAG: tetratricopeptide repeat protein [Opitutae bacterium]|nr:tetratricopeptide repeat protein [Opitutae bacterium]